MAPTAANIAEYRRNPPRKNAKKTAMVAPGTCGSCRFCEASAGAPNARAIGARKPINARADTPQITNWKKETAPAPTTLPNMSSKGRKDETNTSTIRVVFSSRTELITFTPYRRIAMNRRIAMMYAVMNDCPALSDVVRPREIVHHGVHHGDPSV